MEPTKTTDSKGLIDHILTNFPEKVIQIGVVEVRLSNLVLFTVNEISLFKSNEHHEISLTSMKNYLDEIFVEKLRSIEFTNYSNHTCVNDDYQDYISNFLHAFNSVVPIKTIRVKSNTRHPFNIDVLNAI